MNEIGIRELKAHASDVVRRVAEEHATYTITKRGRAVGVLAPADDLPTSGRVADDGAWDRLLILAAQLGARKPGRKSALRELSTMRR